jgi:hypothetical protein
MIEKYIILALLYLEWFVQKLLCLPYKLYIKFDHWNFNRNLDQRNIELAKQTPLSKDD